jgi:type III secretion protein L
MERPGEWQPSGAIVRAEEYQALLDAEGLIADARREAERIRLDAVAEYEREKTRGFADGLKKAEAEAAERLLLSAAETIRGFRAAEGKLIAVVEKAVRKIVGDLPVRDRVGGLVRTALAGLAAEGKAKVRVAAEDLEAARAAIFSSDAGKSACDSVEVGPDPRLSPGACVIETAAGVIDASLEVQLAAVVKALKLAAFGEAEAAS